MALIGTGRGGWCRASLTAVRQPELLTTVVCLPAMVLGMAWRIRTDGVVGGPPIVADGIVYVPSADNQIYAVDAAKGSVRWKYRVTGGGLATFGEPSQIAVAGGTVFVGEHATQAGSGVVHAVDARTGRQKWQRELDDGTALDVTAVDGAVVVQCGNQLCCLDPADGSERWRYAHPMLPNGLWTVPIIADGTVLCGGSDVDPRRSDDLGLLVAVGLDDGQQLWHIRTGDRGFKLAARDGIVYAGTAGGQLWAVEISTADQLWGGVFGMRQTAPPAVPSVAMTTPVVTAEWIYVGCGNGYTYRIDRTSGESIWRWESPVRVEAVCHADGVTYAGLFDGSVTAYPGLEGDLLWWQRGPIGRIQGIAYADGTVFVSGRRHLAAFDARNGMPPWQWRHRTSREVYVGRG